MTPHGENAEIFEACEAAISSMFERCKANAPNFGVSIEEFRSSLHQSLAKFISSGENPCTATDAQAFLDQLQVDDLFLAIACAKGDERAWWEFDQNHRSYLERIARHLASTDINAQEVVDSVYVELYGTRVVDGQRISKFAKYSGRGSIRGWLRTVVWHALVDLHRSSHDEVSLDEMTENLGEGMAHASMAEENLGGEDSMMDELTSRTYRKATVTALHTGLESLDPHEKLLLLYYHVENMKLREIARLCENPESPLRAAFQRKSPSRESEPTSRIHESTVMRWLEKTYSKVLKTFKEVLTREHSMKIEEIELCMELVTKDLAGGNIYKALRS